MAMIAFIISFTIIFIQEQWNLFVIFFISYPIFFLFRSKLACFYLLRWLILLVLEVVHYHLYNAWDWLIIVYLLLDGKQQIVIIFFVNISQLIPN